jgi:hypothetical protein
METLISALVSVVIQSAPVSCILAALIRVQDLWLSVFGDGFFQSSIQTLVSNVFKNRQDSTLRFAQTMMATRYRKPFLTGMYVMSLHQTWLGRVIASFRK